MFNAKDEEIRELLSENSELWLENYNIKMKIFNAIEYLKTFHFIDSIRVLDIKEYEKLLEILGDKENE